MTHKCFTIEANFFRFNSDILASLGGVAHSILRIIWTPRPPNSVAPLIQAPFEVTHSLPRHPREGAARRPREGATRTKDVHSSDLSEYTLFQIQKNIFVSIKINFYVKYGKF